jgi:hypothetical protein
MDDTALFTGTSAHRPKKITPTPDQTRQRRPSAEQERKERREARYHEHLLPPASEQEQHFRHGHWNARRQRLRTTLQSTGASAHALNRWDACGGQCHVEYSPSREKYRLSANYCKSRHCEPCMRAKANLIARNLREKLDQERKDRTNRDTIGIRFITLTLKHSTDPLSAQIKRLTASFKKLRNTPEWKRSQDGGAATLEVKYSPTGWHVHYHIVAAGQFLSAQMLSNLWNQCTGDSYIVDIRALNQVADACHYVSKYITKGTNAAVWENADAAQEWIAASKGLRTINTFGTWRGYRLTKPDPGVMDWQSIRTLHDLITAAQAGELAAQGLLLHLRPPGTSDAEPHNPPPPP